MMSKIGLIIVLNFCIVNLFAQNNNDSIAEIKDSVLVYASKEDIRKNWFLQTGLDVSFQNPYGFRFSDTFKDGSSVGVDLALGRWFTPEISLIGKLNWENGIFDSKANWLAPFYKPGENHRRGGYLYASIDYLLDIHNIIWGYDASRVWNMQLFPRTGVAYNFGVAKGSPLIGVGLGSTFKMSNKYSVYCDLSYNGVSSGFMGNENNTGTGSGSNGFIDFNIGVQYNINAEKSANSKLSANTFVDRSFWNNWFLEFGMDMTLPNPYRLPFKDSFKKGRTFGIDGGLGKWFSPEMGLRGRVNWENGLVENISNEWIPYKDPDKSNYEGNGCVLVYLDAMLSFKHMLWGYSSDERTDLYVFPRVGLGSNLSINSLSPLIGFGFGSTWNCNENWSIYAETSYMGITSEYFQGISMTGMDVSTGFNGLWDLHIGLRLKIGRKKF